MILLPIFLLFTSTLADHDGAFFAIMVTNPTVVQQVKSIGANLSDSNQQFVKFLHNSSRLHVRLNMVEYEDSLPTFLKTLPKAICNISNPIPVIFTGVDIRQNRTLYGKVNVMSSSVITSLHQAIYLNLNASGYTSIDEHEIFHPKMNIVELDSGKHDDLLSIMRNRTADFKLNTGDFVKELVLYHANFTEIGRSQLAPCANFTKPYLLTNRVQFDDYFYY